MINKKNNIAKRAIAYILVSVIILSTTVLLTGCSIFDFLFGGSYIKFTRSSITLQPGDMFDFATVIESETTSYNLASSDSKIVSLSGHTATAVAVGTAYITAETDSYSDRIRVNVTDKEQDGLSVVTDGKLIQTMGSNSDIVFTPKATGSVANTDIVWTVNGDYYEELPADKSFTFMPTAAGKFEVTAASGMFGDSIFVRCYYDTDVSVVPTGEFVQQSEPYSNIDFAVSVDRNISNPDDYFELYEDETLLYAGEEMEYTYRPSPGRHTLYAVVNGKPVYSKDGYFKGSVIPSAPEIVFDNMYPHIYVTYDAVGEVQLEITSSETGVRAVCASTDPDYAALFTENGFDAGGIIDLCASSNTLRNYTVRVKSLGDGDALTESEYSARYVFTQLPAAAKQYVETICLDQDLYLTSETDYVAVAEYYINYRQKTGSESKVAFDCYVAFDIVGSAENLWDDAFPIAATSGEYRGIRVSMAGKIIRTSFTVNTVNTPTRQASESLGGGYAEQLHAILPHINFDEDKYRPENYVFPIDNAEREQSVTYTDELYLAVQRGVRPKPTVGSAAETVYGIAREILRKICADDMTDVEKAHAIYDWIMWHVTYDNPATVSSVNGEAYSAYYLEGVFADGITPIGGVVYKPYAVCDGMSKAYSLMCNMEGIPCVRVVGTAGDSVYDAGGHAWNKVFVNNAWYGVDCTWGDATASIALSGFRQSTYELGMHDYLFVTESKISEEHYEPYAAGESTIVYAPIASDDGFSIYKNMDVNGTTINFFVAAEDNKTERTRDIVTEYAKAYKKTDKITVPGERNGVSNIDWQAFEIYYESSAPIENSVKTLVSNVFKAVHRGAEVKVFAYDRILLVLVRT